MIGVKERRDGSQKDKICTSQLESLSARKSPNRIRSTTTPLQLMKQEKEIEQESHQAIQPEVV
jgi:hypothetical protein